MEMLGNRRLGVTQQQAWEALNDPETLKKCIPGCDKVRAHGRQHLQRGAGGEDRPGVGQVQRQGDAVGHRGARRLQADFEGQGGVAGFAKGSSSVSLKPLAAVDAAASEVAGEAPAAGCELDYTVQAQVGGKIAQLGQRLIDGAAKSTADDFFKRFDAEMQRRYGPPPAAVESAKAPGTRTRRRRRPA
jgi:carbon monoxide dehydrogenase subunit G